MQSAMLALLKLLVDEWSFVIDEKGNIVSSVTAGTRVACMVEIGSLCCCYHHREPNGRLVAGQRCCCGERRAWIVFPRVSNTRHRFSASSEDASTGNGAVCCFCVLKHLRRLDSSALSIFPRLWGANDREKVGRVRRFLNCSLFRRYDADVPAVVRLFARTISTTNA